MKPHGFLFFAPALLYMGLIFYLSSHPAPSPVQDWPVWWDIKSIHLLEYAVLTGLLLLGFLRGTIVRPATACWAALTLAVLWGISDEIHQAFVPERTARVMDAVADLLGGLAAVILFVAGAALRRRRGRA